MTYLDKRLDENELAAMALIGMFRAKHRITFSKYRSRNDNTPSSETRHKLRAKRKKKRKNKR